MGKQEKAAKKKKAAGKKADEIIAATKKKYKKSGVHISDDVAEALAKPLAPPISAVGETPWDSERIEGCTDEQWALGVRCRELRDQGEPWWAIARDLELEGWGTSATTGKKGAARARNVYKAAFGSFPRTFETGRYKGPVERNQRVAELKAKKVADRKAEAKAGKSVIDLNMDDEEIVAMLRGRKIKAFSTDVVPEGMDREFCIHPDPKVPIYIYEESNGDKVIEFREQHRKAPVAFRGVPAQRRSIRLRHIYSVK